MTSAPTHMDLSMSDPASARLLAWAPVGMALYVAVIFVLWVGPPTSLAVDETEQMVNSQLWAWGYGGQPPLYTWLQILVFEVTGPGQFGLAVLKYGLIAAIYLGMWQLARQLGLGVWGAAIAMLGLLLLPTLIWSAQRDLTHSVLLAALSVWTMSAAHLALASGKVWAYGLVGVGFAAGLLSKWNFALLIVGLLGAALVLRQGRASGWGISVLVMVALLAAPALWLLQNPDIGLSSTSRLAADAGPGLASALAGLGTLAEGLVSELTIFALVCLWAFGAALWTRRSTPAAANERFTLMAMGIAFGLMLVGVLLSGTREVNPRWLLPITLFLPLVLALRVNPALSLKSGRRFVGTVCTLALLFGIVIPQAILWASPEAPSRMTPYAEAAALVSDRAPGSVFVANLVEGGNLRAFAPELTVVPADSAAAERLPTPGLAVWFNTQAPQPIPSDGFQAAFTDLTGRQIDLDRITAHQIAYPRPYADQTLYFYMAEVTE